MLTDWLMVIITAIYVIATILICYFNGKSAKAAKKQTEEMIRQFDLANRPNISVRFDVVQSGLLCFVIKNLGAKASNRVNIKINQDFIDNLPDADAKKYLEAMSKSEFFLDSQQELYVYFGVQLDFGIIKKVIAKINILCDNEDVQETIIDLCQYDFMLMYKSPVDEIANYLQSIKDDNKRFFDKHIKSQQDLLLFLKNKY